MCDVVGSVLPGLGKDCDAFVDEKLADVLHGVKDGLKPENICAKFGMCDKPEPPPQTFFQIEDKSIIPCNLCLEVVNYIEHLLHVDELDETNILAQIDRVCNVVEGLLPGLGGDCHKFVNSKIADVIHGLNQGLKPMNLCTKIGSCTEEPKTVQFYTSEMEENKGFIPCSLCLEIVTFVQHLLKVDKLDEEKIVGKLHRVCGVVGSVLPGLAHDCDAYVDEKIANIIHSITTGLKPENICAKMCEGEAEKEEKFLITYDEEDRGLIPCNLCIELVTFIEHLLKVDKLEEQKIISRLHSMCGAVGALLPGLGKDCDAFVENKLADMILGIGEGLKPKNMCIKLKSCEAEPEVPATFLIAAEEEDKAFLPCNLCIELVTFIERLLKVDQLDEEKIIVRLHSMCGAVGSVLPGLAKDCDAFVQNRLEEVVRGIGEGLKPEKICAKNCEKKEEKPEVAFLDAQIEDRGIIPCSLCIEVIAYIEDLLHVEKFTEEKILERMHSVCDIVGSTVTGLGTACHTFVDGKIKDIVHGITEGIKPENLCKKLKACEEGETAVQTIDYVVPAAENRGIVPCNLCVEVVAFTEHLLRVDQLSPKDVLKSLHGACKTLGSVLPGLAGDCHDFVSTKLGSIVYGIASGLEPTALCTRLGFCEAGNLEYQKAHGYVECHGGGSANKGFGGGCSVGVDF